MVTVQISDLITDQAMQHNFCDFFFFLKNPANSPKILFQTPHIFVVRTLLLQCVNIQYVFCIFLYTN